MSPDDSIHFCLGSLCYGQKGDIFFLFFKLYFINYVIIVVPIFSPWPSSTQHPSLPQVIPTPLFMFMSHACKFFWLLHHFLYCTLHPHVYSVTTLNPHTFSTILQQSSNWQPSKCSRIHDSVSVLLFLFFSECKVFYF